jgi:hypothetical protein
MRTRSIGHACLEIETSGLRILTDPWWAGPAYTNQWYAWPTPQPADITEKPVDYVYLSHGHEDHLHVDTLRQLRAGATALVPEFLHGSIAPFLRDELGFSQVIELKHGKTVTLRRGLKATCYVNLTDSILVLEDGDRVLVNANDALHASSPAVIDYLCRVIRSRHPTVDTLYLGFSGASWFPNCLRVAGKHDRSIARAREELFCDNFLRVVDLLQPRVACAFAASFVLVDPQLRWINDVKFEVRTPDQAYAQKRKGGHSRVHLLLPNDVVDGIDIIAGTAPRPSPQELSRAMETTLRHAVERAEHLRPLTPDQLKDLVQRLHVRVAGNHDRLRRPTPFNVEIRLRDNPGIAMRVEVDAKQARAALGVSRKADAILELRAEILDAAISHDYGLESITIGYGAVVTLEKPEHYSRIQSLLALLTPRRGGARAVGEELWKNPLRTLGNVWRQRWPLALSVGANIGLLPHPYELRNLGASAEEAPIRKAA